MIRFLHAYFPARTLFLGVSEACLVVLGFVAATIARLGTTNASLMLNYEQGFLKILVLSAAFITCMYYFDLYSSSIISNRREVVTRFLGALGTASIALACLYYVYPRLELGRGILLIGLAIVSVVLLLWRRLFLAINNFSKFAERTIIFGDEPSASRLMRELKSRPELGLIVIGRILSIGNGTYDVKCESYDKNGTSNGTVTNVELTSIIDMQRVNRIIVALDDRRGRLPVEQFLNMKSRGVRVQDGLEYYEQVTGKVPIESLRLGALLFSSGFRLSRFLKIYKRAASIVVSVIGLILSLPLFPLVALAIKLTSPGRLLYHQKRVGQNNRIFYCHKFRTMRADAEADTGPTWASDEDPRITRVGRFLRTTRLDEIPQLYNVLKGDMSLVGPRPERPEFVESLKREIPYYSLRNSVRPGITGWAQIRYKYGCSVEDSREKLRYDLFYIKHMSLGLDALVFFDTVKTILLGRGAR